MAQLIQVHTAPWPHYPIRNVFSDRRNSLYDKSASFRCDGRLFHSPWPAAANALSHVSILGPLLVWSYTIITVESFFCQHAHVSRCEVTKHGCEMWHFVKTHCCCRRNILVSSAPCVCICERSRDGPNTNLWQMRNDCEEAGQTCHLGDLGHITWVFSLLKTKMATRIWTKNKQKLYCYFLTKN